MFIKVCIESGGLVLVSVNKRLATNVEFKLKVARHSIFTC